MPRTFAGEAAVEVGDLGSSLRDTAAGFAAVTKEVASFAAAREANISVATKELGILSQGLATAKEFNSVLATGKQLGDSVISTGQRGGAGVRASTSTPGGGGVRASTSDPSGGTVLASVNGPRGASGVLVSVNGAEIGSEIASQLARKTTAGDRALSRTITQGFDRLEQTIRSGTRSDGGAAFRAGGGV